MPNVLAPSGNSKNANVHDLKMSFPYHNAAKKIKTGNPFAKSILLYLSERANKFGQCHPKEETIAEELDMGESTVRKWLKFLQDEKKLIRIEKRAGASWKHNAYQMLFEPEGTTVEINLSPLRDSGDKISPLQGGAIPENVTATTYHRHVVAVNPHIEEPLEPGKNVDLDESKSTASDSNESSPRREELPPVGTETENQNAPPPSPPEENPPAPENKPKKPPADPRCEHPAIVLVRRLLQRYPVKEIWDTIIRDVGTDPDVERLTRMLSLYAALGWRGYDWLVWYARGIPKKTADRLLVNAEGFPLSQDEIKLLEASQNGHSNGRKPNGGKETNADKVKQWRERYERSVGNNNPGAGN